MKTKPLLLTLLVLLAACLTATATPAGELVTPTDQDTPWLAEARATYPLKNCLISGEELGGMGKPAEYIYRQAGQPDRLVRFCCKMCVTKFNKDPEKYLAQLAPDAKTEAKPKAPEHP